MTITIYAVLLLTCSSTLCIFGFFVGRCARKIPILDEHLPRALHRGAIPPNGCQSGKESAKDITNCAEDALSNRGQEQLPPESRPTFASASSPRQLRREGELPDQVARLPVLESQS